MAILDARMICAWQSQRRDFVRQFFAKIAEKLRIKPMRMRCVWVYFFYTKSQKHAKVIHRKSP
jgi:hypothetical protein